MNQLEKDIESGKDILRKRGVTFNLFKAVVSALVTNPKTFTEDDWVWHYEGYAESAGKYDETIEEWAEGMFIDFTTEKHNCELRKKHWINADEDKPEHNVGVLVFIPEEDGHITSGMWDISNVWVLLDEYRKPDCKVTHWMPLPHPPKGKRKKSPNANADSTRELLGDIISWEKDLSEYNSLESLLRKRFKISKK